MIYYYILAGLVFGYAMEIMVMPRVRNWLLQRKLKRYIGDAMQREDRDTAFAEAGVKILAAIGMGDQNFDREFITSLVNSKKEEFYPGSPPWEPKSKKENT